MIGFVPNWIPFGRVFYISKGNSFLTFESLFMIYFIS